MDLEKKMSVIIVSYNCIEYLKLCIASIRKHNDIDDTLEIIVVDNSSNLETMEWLQDECPDVIAIKNENKGFGQANNVGAARARGKYLLFLNPDTELVEEIFRFAIGRFESDEQLGCFGIQHLDEQHKPVRAYGLRLTCGMGRVLLNKLLCGMHIFIPSKMFTSGACIFIPKLLFEQCGAFDENIFMYYEEADLCNRVNQQGKVTAYFPQKKIMHLGGRATHVNFVTTYKRLMASCLYYCKKYGYDIIRESRRERNYCRFKRNVFWFFDKERSKAYDQIVRIWDAEMPRLKERKQEGRLT